MTTLTKTKRTTYVPGAPGTVGSPGSPAIPSKCTEVVPTTSSNPTAQNLVCAWGLDGFGEMKYLCIPTWNASVYGGTTI